MKSYKQAVTELLEQITSPNDEQLALMDYIRGILEQYHITQLNKDTVSECLGRIWILNK